MKLFIEKSRFRVGAGERKRLWWRTEQTICLYYQKIIRIRIEKRAFDRLRHRVKIVIEPVEITGMRIRTCLRQAQAPRVVVNITWWLSGDKITGRMSENVPSTSSGTDSSSKYNTVIERSRNHQMKKCTSAFVNFVRRPSVCAQASGVVIINISYKSLKICYFFRKFRVSIK